MIKQTLHWINHQALILPAVEEDNLQTPHFQSIADYLQGGTDHTYWYLTCPKSLSKNKA